MEHDQYALADVLDLSDYEAGVKMLKVAIEDKLRALGIPPECAPADIVEEIRRSAARAETDDASLVAIEKAFHKAAAGQFAVAGRLLKQHLYEGAFHLRVMHDLALVRNEKKARASSGGKKAADAKRQENKRRDDKIRDAHAQLLVQGTGERDVAAKLAKRFGLSDRQIRRIIRSE